MLESELAKGKPKMSENNPVTGCFGLKKKEKNNFADAV